MTHPNITEVPVFEVRRIRDFAVVETCDSPDAALAIARRQLRGLDREHVLTIYLNAQNAVVGVETVCIGFENGSVVTPTTVFRGALLSGAKGIVVAHNHPGGDVRPSPEDRQLMYALKELGEMLKCPLVDFLIVSDREHIGMAVIHATDEPDADPAPIYTLTGAVRRAIEKYDRTKDHSRHEPGADCIRCKIAAVIEGMGSRAP